MPLETPLGPVCLNAEGVFDREPGQFQHFHDRGLQLRLGVEECFDASRDLKKFARHSAAMNLNFCRGDRESPVAGTSGLDLQAVKPPFPGSP